jgi:hypothetical protein
MSEKDLQMSEAEIIDNYRLDYLYTHAFRNDAGKYFTVVSRDEQGRPAVVDFEHPQPVRNKIKTRLTFIKDADGGRIHEIEIKRFKFYKHKGYIECAEEGISFSFSYFVSLVGFLQSLSGLNLNGVNERRIQLMRGLSVVR